MNLNHKYKISISHKIFIITFGLVIGVIGFTFICHSLFFEDFYINQKTKDMVRDVDKFKTLYAYQITNDSTLRDALITFEEENNTRIAIFSITGQLNFISDYNKNSEETDSLTSFAKELLSNKELIYSVLQSQETTPTEFQNGYGKKIGVIAPMSLSFKNDSIIISVSSVQSIKEASSVMLDFYKNTMFALLLVGILLAFIYAKLISVPLIKINQVAEKMSRLNFNELCEVTTNDEIGNLGSTLNFLSAKLKYALDDLKEKNKALEHEIEIERRTEKLRKDFITGVSHELKTPIGIIEGYAEGLRDGIVDGEEADFYLETILEESNRMSDMITNMLEISKLESGTVEFKMECFNILRMINGQLSKQELNLQKKNLKVNIEKTYPYVYVTGDIFNIQLVISNILINAIKYTPENNGINIFFNDLGEYFEICIENLGAFIPDDQIENIFTKFYRGDKSRNRKDRSNGLGLSVVKNILELHNSNYEINNSKNGVIFKFTLKKGSLD